MKFMQQRYKNEPSTTKYEWPAKKLILFISLNLSNQIVFCIFAAY